MEDATIPVYAVQIESAVAKLRAMVEARDIAEREVERAQNNLVQAQERVVAARVRLHVLTLGGQS